MLDYATLIRHTRIRMSFRRYNEKKKRVRGEDKGRTKKKETKRCVSNKKEKGVMSYSTKLPHCPSTVFATSENENTVSHFARMEMKKCSS